MKAFSEWWERGIEQEGSMFEESCPQCELYYPYKRAWKAALEWLKSNEDAYYCECPMLTAIKKELEDTDE